MKLYTGLCVFKLRSRQFGLRLRVVILMVKETKTIHFIFNWDSRKET